MNDPNISDVVLKSASSVAKPERRKSSKLESAQRNLNLYTLFRLFLCMGLLLWSIWSVLETPSQLAALKPQFYMAAFAFFFMGISALMTSSMGGKSWFLWMQLIVDAVFVSSLVASADGPESPYFVLYCVNIIGAVRLLNARGVVLVTLLDSMTYVLVCLFGIYGFLEWPEGVASLNLYTQLSFRVFGLLLVGLLSVSLSLRQEYTEKELTEQVLKTELITRIHASLLDQLPISVFTIEHQTIEAQNAQADALFGNQRGVLLSTAFPNAQGRWEFSGGDSNEVLFEARVVAISDDRHVLFVEDVTRFREIERRALREDRLAAVGRLAASLAHEIRNPLASLSGAVQLLSETQKGKLYDIIQREIKRLNELVEEMLRTFRPPRLNRSYLRPHVLIDEVLDAFQHDSRCRHLTIQNNLSKTSPEVYLDGTWFRQIIWNLFLNASQATIEGDLLTITDDVQKKKWSLTIEDTGSGIPESQLKRIFDPFFTTRSGGTGLGLANVERIVRAHGGEITVNSIEGEGTSFYLAFDIT